MKDFVSFTKNINWQKLVNVAASLDDLNDAQYRFIKGRFIELMLESFSDNVFVFVGEKHKDHICKKFKCTIELKSELSTQLYTQKGLRKTITVRFNNSMGTNSTTTQENHITDYLIIVKKDGAVLLEKKNIIKSLRHKGDGFILEAKPSDVIELSGKLAVNKTYNLGIRDKIDSILKSTIKKLKD